MAELGLSQLSFLAEVVDEPRIRVVYMAAVREVIRGIEGLLA